MNNAYWKLFMINRGGINRARIVNLLNQMPCNANQISNELDLNYMTVRHHLKLLEKNKVIKSDGEEYGTLYSVSDKFDAKLFKEVFINCEKECSPDLKSQGVEFRKQALEILKGKDHP